MFMFFFFFFMQTATENSLNQSYERYQNQSIKLNMNSKALTRTLFHGAVTVMYFYALLGFERLPPLPHKKSHEHYAGRWKYLTYWNLIAQFLYFAFSFIIDFYKASSSHYQKLTKLRDRVYAGIVMPYGMFVVAVFWILYSIDRELIFPKSLDPVFPMWLNHVAHTMILPALLVETYILRHRHPKRRDGIKIAAVFGLTYVVWVLYLALVKDIWPYPILYLLNWGQRVIFFGAGMIFILLTYLISERINSCCWGEGILSKAK